MNIKTNRIYNAVHVVRKGVLFAATAAVFAVMAAVEHVDPMIGTAGGGNTFPGPVWPLGMVQPGPDTGCEYRSSCSGYNPGDPSLMGFTQGHLSGTGCCDLQDFLLLPFTGEFPVSTNRFHVTMDKSTERSEPGYYTVCFKDHPVKAELTCSPRVAFHRYTFEKGGCCRVFVDLQAGPFAWWRMGDPKYPRDRVVASESTIAPDGTIEAHNRVTCWNDDREIFCRIVFSVKPVRIAELPANGKQGRRWILDFELPPGGSVVAKAAVSSVDAKGARDNLASFTGGFDFDACRAACRAAWEELLSKVYVEGDPDRLKMFYTALYHAYVQPNLFSDVDGRFRVALNRRGGRPTNAVTRVTGGGRAYTTFSEWDTYRAAHPLYTILTPGVVDDFVQSMLATYRAVGFLPKWQMFGGENYCMIGVHSIPVMADAYFKGITRASAKDILEAAVRSLLQERDEATFDHYGYIPMEGAWASVSRTLEFGIDDWAVSRLAEAAGDSAAAALYSKRADYYRNLFDPSTGCMRARGRKGDWRTPFDPYKQKPSAEDIKNKIPNDYTEGGAWQYAWHVLQDPAGLAALHGGAEGFAKALEKLFTDRTEVGEARFTGECTGTIGQFALGNEHDQHVPYLWRYANRPDRTAEIVRELCDRYFSVKRNGLCGNDDCGQISAWYIFACFGFYPVNPCSGEYVLGAPQLPKTVLRLAGSRVFTVTAKGLSRENKYVRSVTLNGRPLEGFLLKHADIVAGGELVFEMTSAR